MSVSLSICFHYPHLPFTLSIALTSPSFVVQNLPTHFLSQLPLPIQLIFFPSLSFIALFHNLNHNIQFFPFIRMFITPLHICTTTLNFCLIQFMPHLFSSSLCNEFHLHPTLIGYTNDFYTHANYKQMACNFPLIKLFPISRFYYKYEFLTLTLITHLTFHSYYTPILTVIYNHFRHD